MFKSPRADVQPLEGYRPRSIAEVRRHQAMAVATTAQAKKLKKKPITLPSFNLPPERE